MGEIQWFLDTGLPCLQTLSLAGGYTEKMQWGMPQPETVRDYDIQMKTTTGEGEKVLSVSGNDQRRRVHPFDSLQTTYALRIQVGATNGLDHARIVEMRVY